MLNKPTPAPNPAPLTVLYDGDCPLCRREIALYAGMTPNTPICFVDVNQADLVLPTNTTQAELLARFHVQDSNGQLRSGARAFLLLWSALPGWRWLATLGRLPGATWMLERLYSLFLRVRPLMQRMVRRWDSPTPKR
jgi:3-demethoxyubiquinol 3-hydroxylase